MKDLIAIVAVLASLFVFHGKADSWPLSGASLAPDRTSVVVRIVGPPFPEVSLVANPSGWMVVARDSTNLVGSQIRPESVMPTQYYRTSGQVRLKLSSPIARGVSEIEVFSLIGKASTTTWPRKAEGSLGFFPAPKREKADVFLSGAWIAGKDASPLYDLDLKVGSPGLRLGRVWEASVTSSVRTAKRRDLDPDAYDLAVRFGRIYPIALGETGPYIDLQWDVVRWEFSREDKAENLVTAPKAIISTAILRSLRADRTLRTSIDSDLSIAAEYGDNKENKVVPEGYGTILRLVPGASLYAAFPGAMGLEEIRWTSAYKVRMLAKDEPLIDTRTSPEEVSLGKGPRHQWLDELDLKLNPFLGITIKHEYGSSPPAFKWLDHRITIGAKVMWAWKS